uniref:Lactamase_B domain-containing protein n=1 Tax=Heterorhabditis bacteriophora TaxID=37862 RepID=A0A1I7X3B6_HETBA
MQVTNLSWHPHKPCILLRWPNVTILLDCALDFSSFNQYLPYVYSESMRLKKLPTHQSSSPLKYLKQIRENVYVEGIPEVHPTPLDTISMESVDCILVSNWQSLVALPYYTQNSGFRGVVFATEPVVQFGRLMMAELIEYFERIVLDDIGDKWKDPQIYCTFPNYLHRNPLEWKKFYSKEVMDETLARVSTIAFKQSMGNIIVTAYGSGYSIGSANWVIKTEYDRIGYLSSSSCRSSHTRSVDWEKLRETDSLIMTSLTNTDHSPEGGVSMDTPIYFISPVAKGALAYSNVNAEWLADSKLNAVYVPEEPFSHSSVSLVRSGRLKIYENIYESFSKDYKTPCVVFPNNFIIRTEIFPSLYQVIKFSLLSDPDYPLSEVYGPYLDLAIRAYHFPIETRLDFNQVNNTVLPNELRPKTLFIPDAYTPKSSIYGRPDMVVQFTPYTPMRYDEPITIPLSKKSRKRKIKIHPDLIKKIDIRGHHATGDFGICALTGHLCVYDDAFELLPAKKKMGALRPKFIGRLTADMVLKALQKRNLSGRIVKGEEGKTVIRIDAINSVVTLSVDGLKTNIQAPKEHRALLTDAVTSYLQALC